MDCCEKGHDDQYLSSTQGMCRTCRRIVEARYMGIDGKLYLERYCPEHGQSRSLVANSVTWYLDALKAPSAASPPTKVIKRHAHCPSSCGPCEMHGQKCNLPVFSITNACELRCPICFTFNRNDKIWHMSPEQFKRHIDFVVDSTGGVDLINITGGEPTLHPQLFDLLPLAKRPEIGRITLNTNGLSIAQKPDMAKRLADLGVYVVLSLDTLDAQTSMKIHGADITVQKKKALEALEKAGVQTTLLMVLIAGTNDHELGQLLDLTVTSDFVRSLTIQTMTYTGQGGGLFLPRKHIPVDAVESLIEEATASKIPQSSFIPLPSAHPLCYGVTFLIVDSKGKAHPLTKLVSKEALASNLMDGYLPHPTEAFETEVQEAINRLWSEGSEPELLESLNRLLRSVYPKTERLSVPERQKRAERAIKSIYVHAHMDEDTFEMGRVMRCPDQVPVDAQRLIGACNYNLFYRMHDERFWVNHD